MLNQVCTPEASDATSAPDTVDQPFLAIEVRMADGAVHKIEAAAGYNAMELIRAAGVPIKAECGAHQTAARSPTRVARADAKYRGRSADP